MVNRVSLFICFKDKMGVKIERNWPKLFHS